MLSRYIQCVRMPNCSVRTH